jgi:hypothetical protein
MVVHDGCSDIYRRFGLFFEEHFESKSIMKAKKEPTVDEIKKYKTKELIDFLHKEDDLELEEEDFEIIRKQRVNGRDFLKTSKKEFLSYGIPGGPAKRLADFAEECKEKKLRSFSSYKTQKDLNEVFEKYGIVSGDITRIPQFIPRK